MSIKFLILICLLLSGCAALGMPGAISERISNFDKSKEIVMEPAWLLWGSGVIKFALYKTSKMEEDKAILNVVVKGANNFATKEAVQIRIDGEVVVLDSYEPLTTIETDPGVYNSVAVISAQNWSSKRFNITKDLIKRLLLAKDVWVRVNLSRDYVEGKFSEDAPSAARPAFRNFYNKVWGESK